MRSTRSIMVALAGVALLLASSAGAQSNDATDSRPGSNTCPPPLMICADEGGLLDGCPPGTRCTCVPSCPNCRDCAARVCVADPTRTCRTACDCEPGLACIQGKCIAATAPVFCCENARCPAGEQCQHRDGTRGRCPNRPECRTACDCEPGLGCFDGQCIAGFAPVFCCKGRQCPAGEQCQHRDGRMDSCQSACVDQLWRCETPGGRDAACGADRFCSCSASCPFCEDCGPGVCVPPGVSTPYPCNDDGSCARPGDRCACVSSCAACDDCAMSLCVPGCAADPMCDERQKKVTLLTETVGGRAGMCRSDEECVRIDTSTGCLGTCGAWIHRRYAERVERLIQRIDARYCSSYREDGCRFVTPPCRREVGACIAGRCTGIEPPLATTNR
jgi:hypothetical protein